jgi:predicted DNA-binding transcriptional regulator YafY
LGINTDQRRLERFEVRLRMRAVELIAYWEGRLITNQLTEYFGVTRQQASADIKRYNAEFNKDSLIHDPAVKGYVPKPDFKPQLTTGHINEYLDMISGLVSQSTSLVLMTDDNLAAVKLPERAVKPDVVRVIIKACRQKQSIEICYASMTNPQWASRVISPHTVVYSGFRWHVRAYCHKRNEFRDFVLSRIQGVPVVVDVPNPMLSSAQKKLVEVDYFMKGGRLELEIKKALVQYTLQRYQVDTTGRKTDRPEESPLVSENMDDIKKYLFGA